MAQEIRRKTATISPGGSAASPQTFDLSFPSRLVTEIDIVVPPGPRGNLAWALGAAGVAVLPFDAGQYIITDDEVIHWPLEGYWDSGSWTLFAYNTGNYPHTLEFRFLCNLVPDINDDGTISGQGAVTTVPSLVGASEQTAFLGQ